MGRPLVGHSGDEQPVECTQEATQEVRALNLIGRVVTRSTPLALGVPPELVFRLQPECRVFQPLLSFDAGLLAPQWAGFHLHFLQALPYDVAVFFKTCYKSEWQFGELLHLGTAQHPRPDFVQCQNFAGVCPPIPHLFMELAAGSMPAEHPLPAVAFGEMPGLRWADPPGEEPPDVEEEPEPEPAWDVLHRRPHCLHCSRLMPYVGCLYTASCDLPCWETCAPLQSSEVCIPVLFQQVDNSGCDVLITAVGKEAYLYFCSRCEVQCGVNNYC